MKKMVFLIACFFAFTVSAQVLTPSERKELETELKELREQMENADPEERKAMEAMGLPAMIKLLEQQLSGTAGDKKGAKEESAISEAEKDKIFSKVSASPLPDTFINPGTDISYRVRTNDDFRIIDAVNEYSSFLIENAGFIGRVAPKPVGFAQAITKAKTLCSGKIPAAEFGKLKAKAPQGTKAADYWLHLAGLQGMAGSPEAAFCFLVTAYEADPNNPDVLSNLAGAMAMLGLANESLALLDEIAKRNVKPSPPMGISAEDMLDFTRSYNLMLTGNTGTVRTKLESIAARQPLLSEAKKLLALLDEKEGKDGKPRFMVSRSRSPQAKYCFVYPGEEPEPGEQTYSIDPRSILDPSKGIRGKLPSIKYPQNPEEATARAQSFFLENTERFMSDLQEEARLRAENEEKLEYYVSDYSTQETWGYIIREFVSSLDWRDAKVRELRDKVEEAKKAMGETSERMLKTMYQGMLDLAKIQNEPARRKAERELKMRCMGMMKADIETVDRAIRDYYEEWSWVATMLAAEVGDEAWHRDIELRIQQEQSGCYFQLTGMAGALAGIGMMGEGKEDVSETLEPVKPKKCDDGGIKQKFSFETPDKSFGTSIGLDCEGVSFEGTMGKISVELGLDKKGGYTIFGGPKAGVRAGGAGAELKAGAYISGKIRGGTIERVGVKVEGTVSAGVGPYSVESSKTFHDSSLSFAPGF